MNTRPSSVARTVRLVSAALVLGLSGSGIASSATAPHPAASDTTDAGASIVVVVNDTPITAYSIEQRIKLLSLDGSGGWQQKLQEKLHASDIQQRFRAFVMAHHPKSAQEIPALQRAFVENLRQQALAETRPGLHDKAAVQLINETLEMQEAKRGNVLATDEEVNAAVGEIAKRNKKTQKEFEAAIASTGVSVRAFKDRIRAQMSWQRVLEGRFRGQIVIGKAELAQEIAIDANGAAGPKAAQTELRLQRILIPLKSQDATSSVEGYATADQLRQKAKPCGNLADLAKSSPGARFDDLGMVKADGLAPEVRQIVANANAGAVPPPILTKAGIEIYGVCERSTSDQNGAAEDAARNKIEKAKVEARSRGLLSDLCAAASLEFRNNFKLATNCGVD